MPAGVVYKICPRQSWLEATRSGELVPSPDDVRDGFIHLSAPHQVRGTLERHFKARGDLVLLRIELRALPAETLRWERSRGGEEFPHLYGPLATTSVGEVTPLRWNGAEHELPEDL